MSDWFLAALIVAALIYLGAAYRTIKKEGLWVGGEGASPPDLFLQRCLLLASFVVSFLIAPAVGIGLYFLLYQALFWLQYGQFMPVIMFYYLWPSGPVNDWSNIVATALAVVDELLNKRSLPLQAFYVAFAAHFALAGPRYIFRGLRKLFVDSARAKRDTRSPKPDVSGSGSA